MYVRTFLRDRFGCSVWLYPDNERTRMLITHGWCRRLSPFLRSHVQRLAAYARLKRCRSETVEEYSAQQPLEGCLLPSDYSFAAAAEMPCPFILGIRLVTARGRDRVGFIIECTDRKSTSIPREIVTSLIRKPWIAYTSPITDFIDNSVIVIEVIEFKKKMTKEKNEGKKWRKKRRKKTAKW